MHLQKIIKVKYLNHVKELSDHVGIIVEITNEHGFKLNMFKEKL